MYVYSDKSCEIVIDFAKLIMLKNINIALFDLEC